MMATTERTISAAAGLAALAVAWALAPAGARAETRVDAKADWSVFKADGGAKECWIVSAPTSSTATRGGKDVSKEVNRGTILLMVAIRPAENVKNEVSFSAGYPLKKASTVAVKIGGGSHDLFTDGEWGWTRSAAEDDALIAAMKKGAAATVTGQSQRGTQTVDTFSLKGFSAALEAAQTLCR